MSTKPLTQLERVRGRLLMEGRISRNECLRQVPAITCLSARIKEDYIIRAEDIGRDEVYHLVSWPFDLVEYFKLQPD